MHPPTQWQRSETAASGNVCKMIVRCQPSWEPVGQWMMMAAMARARKPKEPQPQTGVGHRELCPHCAGRGRPLDVAIRSVAPAMLLIGAPGLAALM